MSTPKDLSVTITAVDRLTAWLPVTYEMIADAERMGRLMQWSLMPRWRRRLLVKLLRDLRRPPPGCANPEHVDADGEPTCRAGILARHPELAAAIDELE